MSEALYFSAKGKRDLYPDGVVEMKFVAECADDYGDGRDYQPFFGGGFTTPEDDSQWNLYAKDGELTKYRILRGTREAQRRNNQGDYRGLQDCVNDRYMRNLKRKLNIKNGFMEMECTLFLSGLRDVGNLCFDVSSLLGRREKMYFGHVGYECDPDLNFPDVEYFKYGNTLYIVDTAKKSKAEVNVLRKIAEELWKCK